MTDENAFQNTPFGSFQPNPPGVFDMVKEGDNGQAPKPKRGRPRKAHQDVQKPPQRAKRTSPAATRVPRAVHASATPAKIEIGRAINALAGLTPDDARFVIGVEQAMRPFPAKQRRRIAAAIGALFA